MVASGFTGVGNHARGVVDPKFRQRSESSVSSSQFNNMHEFDLNLPCAVTHADASCHLRNVACYQLSPTHIEVAPRT